MYAGNLADLKINDNFGSGENLLGKCISNQLAQGQLN